MKVSETTLTRAIDNHVATRLRAARQLAGLTLQQVATNSGLRLEAIHSFEAGIYRPTPGKLVVLARIYRQSLRWFLEGAPLDDDVGARVPARAYASNLGAQLLAANHGARMAHAFLAISSTSARNSLVEVAEAMATDHSTSKLQAAE